MFYVEMWYTRGYVSFELTRFFPFRFIAAEMFAIFNMIDVTY